MPECSHLLYIVSIYGLIDAYPIRPDARVNPPIWRVGSSIIGCALGTVMKLFARPGSVARVAPKDLELPHCPDKFPRTWRGESFALKGNSARSVVGNFHSGWVNAVSLILRF